MQRCACGSLTVHSNGVCLPCQDLAADPFRVGPRGSSASTKDTNPKDQAATTRLDMTLFPDTAVAYGALAMTEGDLKYGGFNYRVAGVRVSVYVAAIKRHLAKFYNGEWADPKTGVPHLASILGCAGVLVDGFEMKNVTDDRPPSVDMDKLLTEFEARVSALQQLFPSGPARYTQVVVGGPHCE